MISGAGLVPPTSLAGGVVLKLEYWWDGEGICIFSLQGAVDECISDVPELMV